MRNLPDRRILIRWMFNALGYLLIFGANFVIYSVLRADFWARALFGETHAARLFFLAVALYPLPTALLCWTTAAGLKRNKGWAFPVGVLTCAILLLGFPWLTIAGGIGLYVLTATASQADPSASQLSSKPATDYWARKAKSKVQPVVHTIFWIGAFGLLAWFTNYARKAGMPVLQGGWGWWLWFFGFMLVNAGLHECGHTIVAWAAGFKVQIVSIGPLTFWREHARFRFRIDWGRLFENGGYMGAVPATDRNLRSYEIAVTAAGPMTNLITCIVCLDIFFSLPGTAWQNWWWIAAFNAVITGIQAVTNLIPLGYCDGTMLLHLILKTRSGRMLLDLKRVQQMGVEAEECHGLADFEKELELKRAMLERTLPYGKDAATMIAACYQTLGTSYANVDDWPAAAFHYSKCLEFDGELTANPMLASNVWSGLHLTFIRRHQVGAVGLAYCSAAAVLGKRKAGGGSVTGPAMTYVMLAQTHQRGGDFAAALHEAEQALQSLPPGSITRGYVLRIKAACHLGLNEIEAGLEAARSAADAFRSPNHPAARRNLCWENIAYLGCTLWRAGQSEMPVSLLREGIAHLESGGAAAVAAQYRIKLAAMLRQLGRLNEANAVLPGEQDFSPALRRAFLAERAQLHLASGRPCPAMADCRELLELWRNHRYFPTPEIASAQALLAQACLAAGGLGEAESLALQAADILGPWQHPDSADCLITVALARLQSGTEFPSDSIREALRRIEEAMLLSPAEKARRRDAEAARLQQSAAASSVLAGVR
jgi:tetratricopeptide (TPR) repeat protein